MGVEEKSRGRAVILPCPCFCFMKNVIIFSGTCAARSELTLVSKRISYSFRVLEVNVSFAQGTERTLQIRFFVSPDPSAPSAGHPTGVNLFAVFGEDFFLIGDNESKRMDFAVEVKEKGMYLKMYANNTDVYEHTVDAFAVIETIEEK